jgi:Rne/Rng family ribonuclease
MLVNARERSEVRIALIEDGKLEFYFVERAGKPTLVGNIYKGVVTDVRPALQAVFVDIGLEKRGFLHISEIMSPRGYRGPRLVQNLTRSGNPIMVQVIRDEFGEKGPSLTTDLSLPGRFLVLTPNSPRIVTAKRLPETKSTEMLKRIIHERVRNEVGVILRTASESTSSVDVTNDLDYLLRVWRTVEGRASSVAPPALMYEETDFVLRVVREFFDEHVEEIIVDDDFTCRRLIDFFDFVMPRYKSRVRQYSSTTPLFHKYGIESQVQGLARNQVSLPSGGNLVIEKTEAMTTIDVNSERFVRVRDPEELALRTNLEAGREIMRQLRLRDIGGIIAIDFISMKRPQNKKRIDDLLHEESKKDRNQMTILPMSEFGTTEIARQKVKPSVEVMAQEPCPACEGTGKQRDVLSLELEILRMIKSTSEDEQIHAIEIQAQPQVIDRMEARSAELKEFEQKYRKKLQMVRNPNVPSGRAELGFYNEGGERIMDVLR